MGLWEISNYYFNENADPRTKDWFLMKDPLLVTLISFSYLYFVLRCGPKYMKDKPAYNLRMIIRVYNIFQIISNAALIIATFNAGWYTEVWLHCHPYVYSYEPNAYQMAVITWWLLLLKIVDYVETGFFVLRKKQNQISFLHLYHHLTTVAIAWIVVKYFAAGMSMFFLIVNCSVHVIMYTYYFLTSFGPTVQRIINPVKRFITIIQMVQFTILMIYCLQAYIPGCTTATSMANLLLLNLIINFVLFYNFYRKAYVKPKTK